MTKSSSKEAPAFENCTEIATIIVGVERKKWTIPTDLLCFHSGYFRSALKGGFAEAKTKTVELLEEQPAAFELVVEWLYTHAIGARLPNEDEEEQSAKIGRLLDTWVLSEYLQMPKLQNIIIRLMSDQLTRLEAIPIEEFDRVCGVVSSNSPLYTWMGKYAIWVLSDDDCFYDDCIEKSAVHLLVNVCQKLQVKRRITDNKRPIYVSCLVDEPED
ncbi:hypothetical protein VF21_09686 [Pseudogymnoascus sp. 05NY08]|nr:hypothetical protein VF21_09686 [Pseudogymnoascus sp. 05NY08]